MTLQLQSMLRLRMGWAEPAGPHNAVVLSSRLRLARNLRRVPFPSRANGRNLAAVLEAVFAACRESKALAKAGYLKLDELAELERAFLAERRLISRELAAEPKHRGVVVGDREALSVMVNEEDHLRLQAIDSGLCPGDLWARLDALDSELSAALPFAFHPEWGYLTACPTNIGTALRVSAMLHLPALALAGRINPVLQGLSRLGMAARGIYGEGTRVLGDFYQISNAATLGRSEEAIVAETGRGIENLISAEIRTRRALAEGPDKARLEDLAYRALGILGNCRSISYEETLQHLSCVRLGLSLGWKLPADMEKVNELLVLAQPAHVQMQAGRELGSAERDALRANLLRRRFKD